MTVCRAVVTVFYVIIKTTQMNTHLGNSHPKSEQKYLTAKLVLP